MKYALIFLILLGVNVSCKKKSSKKKDDTPEVVVPNENPEQNPELQEELPPEEVDTNDEYVPEEKNVEEDEYADEEEEEVEYADEEEQGYPEIYTTSVNSPTACTHTDQAGPQYWEAQFEELGSSDDELFFQLTHHPEGWASFGEGFNWHGSTSYSTSINNNCYIATTIESTPNWRFKIRSIAFETNMELKWGHTGEVSSTVAINGQPAASLQEIYFSEGHKEVPENNFLDTWSSCDGINDVMIDLNIGLQRPHVSHEKSFIEIINGSKSFELEWEKC